jgi:hypothetical protein
VGSAVSSGGNFTLDHNQHLFCNNSVILICLEENVIDPYFLLAVLNSKVFWVWARHRMPTLGSGWYSYRVGILRKFPIPIPQHGQDSQLFKGIAYLASKLLNEELNETERTSILSLVDSMASELYGVSETLLNHR